MTTLIHYDFPALFLLGGLCVLLKPTYFLMDKGLLNIEKYNKLPLDKRKYVIKNFIKSFQFLSAEPINGIIPLSIISWAESIGFS